MPHATARSTMNNESSIVLVGCGKMGSAMLDGWLAKGLPAGARRVVVVDPAGKKPAKMPRGVAWTASLDDAPKSLSPLAVVLAVKPQQMAAVLPAYRVYGDAVFLSIAAGQTTWGLSSILAADGKSDFAVVRSMPNLPASIGEGMSVAFANPKTSSEQRELCEKLLAAVGDVAWVTDEALLDPVTALSGSGPAYVFALVEAMASAGERLGIPAELSMRLARRTVTGSGALLARSPETASALRQAVTSPGGTTAAAMDHLMADGGLPELMSRAMRAASSRAKELAE